MQYYVCTNKSISPSFNTTQACTLSVAAEEVEEEDSQPRGEKVFSIPRPMLVPCKQVNEGKARYAEVEGAKKERSLFASCIISGGREKSLLLFTKLGPGKLKGGGEIRKE